MIKIDQLDQSSLMSWYNDNHRPLPWRRTKDPYAIWISEVMLQQTTVVAVLPFYDRFLKAFPTLDDLAAAPLEDVLALWSGLGYYSRARNLHRAAREIQALGQFPSQAKDLEKLPGFGPYTSRAVATFAFGEKVGVLDGNVIRVLSRRFGIDVQHWRPRERQRLQDISDQLAQVPTPDILNQSLIEIGATVCTPQNPSCLLCPWKLRCVARKTGRIAELPLKKPKEKFQIWLWRAELVTRQDRVAFLENNQMPFLKGQWVFPGTASLLKKKPKKFDVRHGITKYDIYIKVNRRAPSNREIRELKWVPIHQVKKLNPTSLIQKILEMRSE
jgi:A/G-specific adenine glycosylase